MLYIARMIRVATFAFALSVAASVVPAQDTPSQGETLMEDGVDQFFEGLRENLSPMLDELQGFAAQVGPEMRRFLDEMGPALEAMIGDVRDWSHYEAPEMLENGDILIRRKPDPQPDPSEPNALPDPPPGTTDI